MVNIRSGEFAITIEHLVLDLNGTLACDGRLLRGDAPGLLTHPQRHAATLRQLERGYRSRGSELSGEHAGSPTGSTSRAHSIRFHPGTGVRTDGRGTNCEGSICCCLWM